jgi:purine-binding chemotaxis protein CheW
MLSVMQKNLPARQEAVLAESRLQDEQAQYLTFLSHDEMYAIGILNIKEILEYQQPATVPMMPSFLKGVINLRGSVVPVVDLCARFGGEHSDITKRSCIVIIEVTTGDERQDIGVVVDAVSEVLEIPDTEIEPPPSFGAKIRTDFIQGMGKVKNDFVIILNIANVLSVEELAGE